MKSGYSFFPFILSVNMIDVDYYRKLSAPHLLNVAIFNQSSIAVNGARMS